jgi:hypothetical protein
MTDRLDPERLTPAASLNRVRIVELPGVAAEPEVLGRTAYELLSAEALAEIVRQHADALGLVGVSAAEPADLLPRFDRCFADDEMTVRATAEAIARRCGRRLGSLVLTLRRGDAANRRARPDWDDSYWAHWAAVRTIHIAGGVVTGNLGPRLVEHAARTLADAGMTDCDVRVASWPVLLPLIGAARTAGPASVAAVVLDFGQSFVKRGHAHYQDGTLTELHLLPSLSSCVCRHAQWRGADPGAGAAPGDFMATVMADIWQAARALNHPLTPMLVASFASYVRDGQPLPRQGGPYAALLTLPDNLARWLSDRSPIVSDSRSRSSCSMTARRRRARTPGESHAAVIMLGTALGVGFPPPARSFGRSPRRSRSHDHADSRSRPRYGEMPPAE